MVKIEFDIPDENNMSIKDINDAVKKLELVAKILAKKNPTSPRDLTPEKIEDIKSRLERIRSNIDSELGPLGKYTFLR